MYCSKCNTKNSGKGLFCKKCGASLVESYLDQGNDEYYDEQSYNDGNNRSRVQKTKTVNKNKTINKNKTVNKDKKPKKRKNNNHNIETRTEKIHRMSAFQKLMFTIMFLIILILTIALLAIGIYVMNDKTVEVPDVVGMSYDKAEIILSSSKLHIKKKIEEVEDENSNNIVLSQNKNSGERILKNSTITITVGKLKEKENTLENYVGEKIDIVTKKLDKLGIDYEIKEVIAEDESEGIIISQIPTGGNKITNHSKITFTVAKKTDNKNNDIKQEKDEEDEEDEEQE